jgi:hypothetical protein
MVLPAKASSRSMGCAKEFIIIFREVMACQLMRCPKVSNHFFSAWLCCIHVQLASF